MAVRKTVLITGATGGIGTAFARAYVFLAYMHLHKEYKGSCLFKTADKCVV